MSLPWVRRSSSSLWVYTSYTAFSGAGNTMADDDATLSNDAALGVAATGVGSAEFSVDASLPTTNVRVTMANGKRQVFKFNTTHTVADLLAQVGRWVAAERPWHYPY